MDLDLAHNQGFGYWKSNNSIYTYDTYGDRNPDVTGRTPDNAVVGCYRRRMTFKSNRVG